MSDIRAGFRRSSLLTSVIRHLSSESEKGCADGGSRDPSGVECKGKLQRKIRRSRCQSILRKEVIQPQVPLRLPCYDFTPVADPTVVGGLIRRLRVEPTPMV